MLDIMVKIFIALLFSADTSASKQKIIAITKEVTTILNLKLSLFPKMTLMIFFTVCFIRMPPFDS